jgi:type III secretory pathway component EscU
MKIDKSSIYIFVKDWLRIFILAAIPFVLFYILIHIVVRFPDASLAVFLAVVNFLYTNFFKIAVICLLAVIAFYLSVIFDILKDMTNSKLEKSD